MKTELLKLYHVYWRTEQSVNIESHSSHCGKRDKKMEWGKTKKNNVGWTGMGATNMNSQFHTYIHIYETCPHTHR